MALKGLNTQKAIPFVPEIERTNEVNPTIFWVKPRNTRQNYSAMDRYSNASTTDRKGNTSINALKMYEADKAEFLTRVEKVDNYQFSDKFPELSTKGISSFEGEEDLKMLIDDLDPAIFQEVLDATANWGRLLEGEKKDLKS